MPTLLQAQVLTTTASHPFNGMLVAIDARVEAYQMLAAGVLPGTKVIILDPDQDGVELITTTLTSCQATSLHIVCHGEPGWLHLGKTPLHAGNLGQYSQQLRQWRVRDIILVACNVAAEGGLSFLRQLREIAGANIAASARRVGNQALGGLGIRVPVGLCQLTPGVFAGSAANLSRDFPPVFLNSEQFYSGDWSPFRRHRGLQL